MRVTFLYIAIILGIRDTNCRSRVWYHKCGFNQDRWKQTYMCSWGVKRKRLPKNEWYITLLLKFPRMILRVIYIKSWSFFFFLLPASPFVNCCRCCAKDLMFQARTGHLLRKECSPRSPLPLTGGLVGPDFQPHSLECRGSDLPVTAHCAREALCSLLHTHLKSSN